MSLYFPWQLQDSVGKSTWISSDYYQHTPLAQGLKWETFENFKWGKYDQLTIMERMDFLQGREKEMQEHNEKVIKTFQVTEHGA